MGLEEISKNPMVSIRGKGTSKSEDTLEQLASIYADDSKMVECLLKGKRIFRRLVHKARAALVL